MTTKKRLKTFTIVFLASAAIIVLNGIVQKITGADLIWHNELMRGRVYSSFRHPNNFGGYLVVVVPIILSSLLFLKPGTQGNRTHIYEKLLVFVLFLLAVTCLGLTFSRGAWIAFFISVVLMGFIRLRIFYIPVLIIIAFMFFFAPQMQTFRNVSLFSDIAANDILAEPTMTSNQSPSSADHGSESEHPNLLQYVSNFDNFLEGKIINFAGSGRKSFWRESIHIIHKSPVLGIGLNTYSQVAPEFKITWGGYPHNCYLQLTAEMGLVGLAAFLWIFITLFRYSLRHLRAIGNDFLSCLFLGSLMSVFGYLAHIFVDTDLYEVQLGNLVWVLMGMIVAVYKIQSGSMGRLDKDHAVEPHNNPR